MAWQLDQKNQCQRDLDKNLARVVTAKTDLDEKEVVFATLVPKIQHWESPQIYFELALGEIVKTGTTDADGRFSIEVPKHGDFIIAAQASRLTGGIIEEYGWLAPFNADKDKVVFLNNDNLLPSIARGVQP